MLRGHWRSIWRMSAGYTIQCRNGLMNAMYAFPSAPRGLTYTSHLSLIPTVALVDPRQVHHAVHGPVRDLRREFDVGAIEGHDGRETKCRCAAVLAQIVGQPVRASDVSFVPGIGRLPAPPPAPGCDASEIRPRVEPTAEAITDAPQHAGRERVRVPGVGREHVVDERLEVGRAAVYRERPDVLEG